MTSDMSIDKHLSNTRKACFFHLQNLKQLKQIVPKKMMHTLIHAYITSRMDFCNSLLAGSTQKQIKQLQVIQNSCVRLLHPRVESITEKLSLLHWLPVKYRVLHKLLTIAHKWIHDSTYPSYVNLLVKNPTRITRSAECVELVHTYKPKLKTVGDKSIYIQVMREWNRLPTALKKEGNHMKFRRALKTHLFKLAF